MPDTTRGTVRPFRALEELEAYLRAAGFVAIAFSGGLDSRFLVHTALRAGVDVLALHAAGPHIPRREQAYAEKWAEQRGVALHSFAFDPLLVPALANNPKDRCYHCKKTLFTTIREHVGTRPLLDGTTASDMGEYRPGIRALNELGVQSPLAAVGLTKNTIRLLAAATDMDNAEQTPQPCLLTRFAYGMRLNAAWLSAMDAGEEAISHILGSLGFDPVPGFRLRAITPERTELHIAGAELAPEKALAIAKALETKGFSPIPVKGVATLSGFFDRPETETPT